MVARERGGGADCERKEQTLLLLLNFRKGRYSALGIGGKSIDSCSEDHCVGS